MHNPFEKLMAHFIMSWLSFPDNFTKDCKVKFLSIMQTKFTSDERETIKLYLEMEADDIFDTLDRKELCEKALDITHSNPLSVILNIKRSDYRLSFSQGVDRLARFQKRLDSINAKLKPTDKQGAIRAGL